MLKILLLATLAVVATGAPITSATVNFGREVDSPAGGTFRDYGLTYRAQGNYDYGWNCDQTANSRSRTGGTTNAFWDRLIVIDRHNVCGDTTWDLSVVNGQYDVTLFFCDAEQTTATSGCSIEGVSASLGLLPRCLNEGNRATWSGRVTVSDGKLTLGGEYGSGCGSISGLQATIVPTPQPTSAPTTKAPTDAPTEAPTTGAPTTAPTTGAPTTAPTGAPTSATTFGAMKEADLGASIPVLLGAIGDTVYKCGYLGNSDFICMKNLAGSRHTWSLVDDASETDSIQHQDSLTTTDGDWTVDPNAVTFTSNVDDTSSHVFVNACNCE